MPQHKNGRQPCWILLKPSINSLRTTAMTVSTNPTEAFYASLQCAFDHFSEGLFAGKLPPCLITLRSSSLHYGYHHKDRFIY